MTRRSAPKGASHSLAAKQDRGQRTTTDPKNATTDITDIEAWRMHRYVMSLSDEELRRARLRSQLEHLRLFAEFALDNFDGGDGLMFWCGETIAQARSIERELLKAAL